MTGFIYNVIRFLVFTALMVSMASNIKNLEDLKFERNSHP